MRVIKKVFSCCNFLFPISFRILFCNNHRTKKVFLWNSRDVVKNFSNIGIRGRNCKTKLKDQLQRKRNCEGSSLLNLIKCYTSPVFSRMFLTCSWRMKQFQFYSLEFVKFQLKSTWRCCTTSLILKGQLQVQR